MRHGETEWNATKRAQGQADLPLNDAGRRQAAEAARALATETVEAVYASDLVRATDTAEAIAERHGLKVIRDPRLREIDQGEWEGLTGPEIRRRWPGQWEGSRHVERRPGGESPEEVTRRALEALADIVARHPHGTVVVVSHGGTIRWISAEALGYGVAGSGALRGLLNGGLVSVEAKLEGGTLALANLVRWDGMTPDLDDPNV